jgi:hypothetical protein
LRPNFSLILIFIHNLVEVPHFFSQAKIDLILNLKLISLFSRFFWTDWCIRFFHGTEHVLVLCLNFSFFSPFFQYFAESSFIFSSPKNEWNIKINIIFMFSRFFYSSLHRHTPSKPLRSILSFPSLEINLNDADNLFNSMI